MSKARKPDLKTIEEAVRRLDPDSRYVTLDIARRRVQYSPEFILHDTIVQYVGEEEPTRAFIVAWLCTKGGYLPPNIELEKRYSVGRPKAGAKLDILLNRPEGRPYALIEVKSYDEYDIEPDKFIKGQLFDIALHEPGCEVLSYATVELGKEPRIRVTSIDYPSHPIFEAWITAGRPSAGTIPTNYGQAVHVPLTNGGSRDLKVDVPQRVFEGLRKRLHDVLWRGSKPDNVVYSYVVKLFLAKIYDEKTTDTGSEYRFQIRYRGSWPETAPATFARINQLYADAYQRYLAIDDGDHVDPFNENDFSPEQIAFVVLLLQEVSFTSSHEGNRDILGSFFEGITREGFKQSKGLFFTHINLATFILKALDVEELASEKILSKAVYSERLPYIVDPACGSGTFLLTAMKLITESVTSSSSKMSKSSDVREFLHEQFPSDHPNRWAREFLYGLDDSELLAMSTKVNMVLHRDGNVHIAHADALAPLSTYSDPRLRGTPPPDSTLYTKSVTNSFDVVVSNPPFSITLDPQTTRLLNSTFEFSEERNSENLFFERWYQLLKPRGRLGVVLPESFFSTKENIDARLFLFAHFNVKAIVGLPRHAFEPWTPTRTNLLFAAKKTVEEERSWIGAFDQYLQQARQALRELSTGAGDINRFLTAAPPDVQGLLQQLRRSHKVVPADLSSLATVRASFAAWERVTAKSGSRPSPDEQAARQASLLLGRVKRLLEKAEQGVSVLQPALDSLGLETKAPLITDSLPTLANAVHAIRLEAMAIQPRAFAFQRTVEANPGSFYVLSVDNIGYKRTRRAEYSRPNDLFQATQRAESNGSSDAKRITNLNLASGSGRIEVSASGKDALSRLKAARLWQ